MLRNLKPTLLLIFSTIGMYAQVGIGTPTPSATLDIIAANPTGATTGTDGVIVPRIDRQRAQVMTGTVTSTLIYVNSIATGTAAGTAVNITSTGFYYYDGTVWVKLNNPLTNDWAITGNTGTAAATNFIGTTDGVDFVTRTNNTEKTRVTYRKSRSVCRPIFADFLNLY